MPSLSAHFGFFLTHSVVFHASRRRRPFGGSSNPATNRITFIPFSLIRRYLWSPDTSLLSLRQAASTSFRGTQGAAVTVIVVYSNPPKGDVDGYGFTFWLWEVLTGGTDAGAPVRTNLAISAFEGRGRP